MELEDSYGSFDSRGSWLRIQSADPAVTYLKVSLAQIYPGCRSSFIANTDVGELGRDIGANTHLRKLKLAGYSPADGAIGILQMLCEGLAQNQSIEKLCVYGDDNIAGEMCRYLTPFLEGNQNLKTVDVGDQEKDDMCQSFVSNSGGLDIRGIRLVAAPLLRREFPLEKLVLMRNKIDDDVVEALVVALLQNPDRTPKVLDFSHNCIDQRGYESLARLVQDRRCTLKNLVLFGNRSIQDNAFISFARALIGNTTLERMELPCCNGAQSWDDYYDEDSEGSWDDYDNERTSKLSITETAMEAFRQTICNTTSINATVSSNHTFQYLGYSDGMLPVRYLNFNRNENKNAVARRKIFEYHYVWCEDAFLFLSFFDKLEPDLLVRILELIEEYGGLHCVAWHSMVYSLVKHNPMVCGTKKPVPTVGGNSRKRSRC